MNHITRKLAALAVTLMVGAGIVAAAAPAQAIGDTSWGQVSSPTPPK